MAGMQNALSAANAPVLPLPVSALAHFRQLMARDGWDVDVARFCTDRGYAQDCLATAHTSGNAALRAVALRLFDTVDRNCGAHALH
jgi:hypothetical protein